MVRRGVAVVATVLVLVGLVACTRSSSQKSTGGTSPSGSTPGTGGGGNSSIDQAIAKGNFGSIDGVCGPAQGTNAASGGQGISADSITVGTFSDTGATASPGLNQMLFDTADVFTKWCNSLGGVNGRKISLDKHDAALFEYKQRMIDACNRDAVLVGGGAVFDNTGQDTRLQCMLPDIAGYVVSAEARGADLMVGAIPNPINTVDFGVARYLDAKFPNAKKVALLNGNVPATILIGNQYKEAGQHFGWNYTFQAQYNAVGEPSWDPFAQKIKNAGVNGLVFVGEPQNFGKLLIAIAQTGYKLDWAVGSPNMYDTKLISTAGGALSSAPAYEWEVSVPFEYLDKSPALQEYKALYAKYAPGRPWQTLLGVQAFSSWLLFAQSAKKCGANLTRKCLYDNAKAVTSWDGGGLHATTDPGANTASQCMVPLLATPKGFEVQEWKANKSFFNCDPANVVTLKGNYGQGTTLASVGKSMADLK